MIKSKLLDQCELLMSYFHLHLCFDFPILTQCDLIFQCGFLVDIAFKERRCEPNEPMKVCFVLLTQQFPNSRVLN